MSDARISQVSFNTVASLVIVSAISFNTAASTTDVRVSQISFNTVAAVAPVAQVSFGGHSVPRYSANRPSKEYLYLRDLRKRQIVEDEEVVAVLFQAINNGGLH